MKILGFKIWYSGHTVTGKTYNDWVNASDDDVQVVMLYMENPDPNNLPPLRQVAIGNDYYSLDENMALNQGDDTTQLSGHIKNGKWTTDDTITQLQLQSMEDYAEGEFWSPPTQRPIGMKAS